MATLLTVLGGMLGIVAKNLRKETGDNQMSTAMKLLRTSVEPLQMGILDGILQRLSVNIMTCQPSEGRTY